MEPDKTETFHDQVGYWLWEPATGNLILSSKDPTKLYEVSTAGGGSGHEHEHGCREGGEACCAAPRLAMWADVTRSGFSAVIDTEGTIVALFRESAAGMARIKTAVDESAVKVAELGQVLADDDKRYARLVGGHARSPVFGAPVPILAHRLAIDPPQRDLVHALRCAEVGGGHALAIGVTSYDGAVYYGITADRAAAPIQPSASADSRSAIARSASSRLSLSRSSRRATRTPGVPGPPMNLWGLRKTASL